MAHRKTSTSGDAAQWPAHTSEERPWRQRVRSGTRADRTLSSVTVSRPPAIAELPVSLPGPLASATETAVREITALDQDRSGPLGSLGTMLLRTESVASSKIERVQADIDDYARALHGSRANSSAVSMAAATTALGAMIDDVGRTKAIDLTTMTRAHRSLMADDPYEQEDAGRLRTVQSWIGGSDHSPRGALYVPPPPETVEGYMDDLIRFANRDDLPSLAQAALAHAQFESIHPFTDSNGRIGRALVNTILRRRDVTSNVVVPIASSLVARRDAYFSALDAYRAGDTVPIIEAFARAATISASESRVTAARLASAGDAMTEMVGSVRRGSAAAKLIALFPTVPVISADDARTATGASNTAVYDALDRLQRSRVIRPLTNRQRDQVWGATVILDELEDLGLRIEIASR